MRPCGSPDWGRSPDLRHWALLERKEEGTEGRHAGHAVDDGGTFRSPFLLPHSPPSSPNTVHVACSQLHPCPGPLEPFPRNACEACLSLKMAKCGFYSHSAAPVGSGQGERVADSTPLPGSLSGPTCSVPLS